MTFEKEMRWKWYAGSNEESFSEGPFETREQAIDSLDGYSGFIIEARKVEIKIDSYFDAEAFLELVEDDHYHEDGPEPVVDITTQQLLDLEVSVQEAIRIWQRRHGLTFYPWYFSNTRGLEQIHGSDV